MEIKERREERGEGGAGEEWLEMQEKEASVVIFHHNPVTVE